MLQTTFCTGNMNRCIIPKRVSVHCRDYGLQLPRCLRHLWNVCQTYKYNIYCLSRQCYILLISLLLAVNKYVSEDPDRVYNMGVISFLLGQVAFTSLTLGTLKRHAVIQFKPEAITNETARMIVSRAVSAAQLRLNCPKKPSADI